MLCYDCIHSLYGYEVLTFPLLLSVFPCAVLQLASKQGAAAMIFIVPTSMAYLSNEN